MTDKKEILIEVKVDDLTNTQISDKMKKIIESYKDKLNVIPRN